MSFLYRRFPKDPKGQGIIFYQGSGTPCANSVVPKHPGDLYFDVTSGSMYISQVWHTSSTAYATMWRVVVHTKAP